MARAPQVALESGDLLAWYDRHARKLPWRIGPTDSRTGHTPRPLQGLALGNHAATDHGCSCSSPILSVLRRAGRRSAIWPLRQTMTSVPPGRGLAIIAAPPICMPAPRRLPHGVGSFPQTAAELKALPGIGDYTSAAIAAIAFDEAVAVVDGNVERVVTRLFRLDTPDAQGQAAGKQRRCAHWFLTIAPATLRRR
jgi:A/G-specific adenine glycosylase